MRCYLTHFRSNKNQTDAVYKLEPLQLQPGTGGSKRWLHVVCPKKGSCAPRVDAITEFCMSQLPSPISQSGAKPLGTLQRQSLEYSGDDLFNASENAASCHDL